MMKKEALPALTKRESDVLKLIWKGQTTKQLAKTLDISPKTVDVHRASIFRKYRVRNVAQLLRIALVNRILTI